MRICKELNIDDPVTWMNAVPPDLIDLWVAHTIVETQDEKPMEDPDKVFDAMFKNVRENNG